MLAMRRTLFLVPIDDVPIVHAAASLAVAERERARTIGMLTDGGIGPDPAALLEELEAIGLAAVRELGEASTAELTAIDPRLGLKMTTSPRQGLRRHDQRLPEGLLPPRAGWSDRPRQAARHLDRQPDQVEPDRALAPGRHRRDAGRRRPGRARPALAASVRAGHPRRHQVVDGLDGRRDEDRRWRRSTPSRWTSTEAGSATSCPTTSSRPRRPSRGSRCSPRSTPRRWAGRSATGISVGIAPRCSTPPATPARRSGSTGASSAAGRSARTARSRRSSSRTSGAETRHAIDAEAPAWPSGSGRSASGAMFPTPLEIDQVLKNADTPSGVKRWRPGAGRRIDEAIAPDLRAAEERVRARARRGTPGRARQAATTSVSHASISRNSVQRWNSQR